MPLASPADPAVKIDGDEITITIGPRTYQVLGLEKNTSRAVMRVNVRVSGRNLRGERGYHGDTLDMELARQRASFIKQASHELGVKEETIHREVGKVWTVLSDLQREQIRKTLETPEDEALMTAEEQDAAMNLLRDPRLMERVLADFERCGVVGEETNKTVSYLAAVSRLLDKPLAIVVQSSSAAGKSSLMEAVLDFMPEEQREEYSAMTGQALFYMGQKNLKHKILAVSEEEGASRASYALKLLQSEGVLKIASTGKDPVSGKLVTHEYMVEGPVMIFLTTTAQEVDEELLNRCIVLSVNEEREQTRAIHRIQRESRTLDGHWARRERSRIIWLPLAARAHRVRSRAGVAAAERERCGRHPRPRPAGAVLLDRDTAHGADSSEAAGDRPPQRAGDHPPGQGQERPRGAGGRARPGMARQISPPGQAGAGHRPG